MMTHSEHVCHGHGHGIGGVHQTLDEMDFQRGPWSKVCDGDFNGVNRYLEKGGNPSIPDSAGYTPLHYAVRYGDVEMTELLLQKGADVNARTRAGQVSPLHRASTRSPATIHLLLRYNADPCAQDNDGKTPLHCAVEGRNMENCEILFKHSPQCASIRDKNGKTAQDYIHEADRNNLVSFGFHL